MSALHTDLPWLINMFCEAHRLNNLLKYLKKHISWLRKVTDSSIDVINWLKQQCSMVQEMRRLAAEHGHEFHELQSNCETR
jgi:hypothetical protein